jgi:hypothetical protein
VHEAAIGLVLFMLCVSEFCLKCLAYAAVEEATRNVVSPPMRASHPEADPGSPAQTGRRLRFQSAGDTIARPSGLDHDVQSTIDFAKADDSLMTTLLMMPAGPGEGGEGEGAVTEAQLRLEMQARAAAGWGKMRTGMERMTERCGADQL